MELNETNFLPAFKKMATKIDDRKLLKIIAIVQSYKDDAEERLADEEKKYRLINEQLKALREEHEIDVNELNQILLGQATGKTTPRAKREKLPPKPPKYKYTDEAGEEKTWSGSGPRPKALKALIDEGHKIEEFLIKKEPSFSNPV